MRVFWGREIGVGEKREKKEGLGRRRWAQTQTWQESGMYEGAYARDV